LIKPFTDMTVKALGAAGDGAAKSLHMLRDPQKGMAGSHGHGQAGLSGGQRCGALALMPDDSRTRLKGKPGAPSAWPGATHSAGRSQGRGQGAELFRQRRVCSAVWPAPSANTCKSLGDDVTGKEIRAMIPVNLRPLDQAYKLGNRFGLVPLVLPIGVENPIERVYEVRRRMTCPQGQHPAAAGVRPAGRGRSC
jgi:diacylglycerol O-acyltransferase